MGSKWIESGVRRTSADPPISIVSPSEVPNIDNIAGGREECVSARRDVKVLHNDISRGATATGRPG